MIAVKCDLCRKELKDIQPTAAPVLCERCQPHGEEYFRGLVAIASKARARLDVELESYRNAFMKTNFSVKTELKVVPHAG